MNYFCFSDIHGHRALFKKILKFLNKQSAPWKCIFLGDAADRQKNGYEIIKCLLNDKEHFIYLKGNHEDMLVRAARQFRALCSEKNIILKAHYGDEEAEELIMNFVWYDEIGLYIQNGGLETLKNWLRDGAPMKIISELNNLPESYDYVNKSGIKIHCCHAGHFVDNSDNILWSREHFNEKWPYGIMIHGHTPVRSLMKFGVFVNPASTNQPVFYQDNTKICMDTACFASEVITLLNLNTFEQHRFYTDSLLKAVKGE